MLSRLLLVCLCLIIFEANAVSYNTLYGHFRASLDQASEDLQSVNGEDCSSNRSSVFSKKDTNIGCKLSMQYISSQSSYIGWRGYYSSKNSWSNSSKSLSPSEAQVYYQLEFGINIEPHNYLFTGYESLYGELPELSRRNQFIGIRGKLGDLSFGRDMDVLQRSQAYTDLFDDLPGSFNYLLAGELRRPGVVNYYYRAGLSYAGVSLATKDMQPQSYWLRSEYEDFELSSSYALSVGYGDPKLNNSTTYFALAYSDGFGDYDPRLSRGIPSGGDQFAQQSLSALISMQIIRAVAEYRWNSFKLGAVLQQQTPDVDKVEDYYLKASGIPATRPATEKDVGSLIGGALSLSYDLKSYQLQFQAVLLSKVASAYTAGFTMPIDNKDAKVFFYYTFRTDSLEIDSQTAPIYEVKYQFASVGISYDF